MSYTLVPSELIVDGAITSAKLDTNISVSGTLGVTGEVTLATHLNMGDNDKIKIGTGGDLEIYHDGSNSYIANSTGNIYIADTNGAVHIQAKLNEESIVASADGAVTLYHDNSAKLATASGGVTVTGALTATTLAGTLSTAAQTNITSVGTLTGFTSTGIDDNADALAITIDSSENILIGKSATGGNTAGMQILKGSFFSHVRDDGVVQVLNRKTSNGDILQFELDNTAVGVIGVVNSDRMVFATADGLGLQFDKDNNRIIPCDAAGAYNNNVELGDSSLEFTNLWLSNNAYIGNAVGIGNTVASSMDAGANNLVVGTGSGTEGMTIYSGTANSGVIYFADGASGDDRFRGQIGYSHSDNAFSFRTNASGSANMTIDSSGNVGIGDTSPAAKLEIKQGSANWYEGIRINRSDNATQFGTFSNNGGATFIGAADTTGSDNNAILFVNSTNGTTYTERVRIASDGALVVNNSGGNAQIYLGGTSGTTRMYLARSGSDTLLFNVSDGHMRFGTNNIERMRVDSTGNLLHGVQSTSAGFITDGGILLRQDNGHYMQIASGTTSDADLIIFYKKSGSGVTSLGSISSSGNNLVYGGTSDYRLKENIKPLENGLQKLKKLNPVQFDWKETGGTNEGFIAHEVQDICKEAVSGEKDGEVMQSMDYGRITPILVKAIQEQQEQIETLKAEVQELKDNG